MTDPRRSVGFYTREPRLPKRLLATFTGGPLGASVTYLIGMPAIVISLGCGLALLSFPPGDPIGQWLYRVGLAGLCLSVLDMVVATARERWSRR